MNSLEEDDEISTEITHVQPSKLACGTSLTDEFLLLAARIQEVWDIAKKQDHECSYEMRSMIQTVKGLAGHTLTIGRKE